MLNPPNLFESILPKAQPLRRSMLVGMLSSGWLVGGSLPSLALPQTPTVRSGEVRIQQNNRRLNIIQATPNASIDWHQFSIGGDESVHFRQPSRQSVTLNRVTGDLRSTIAGSLKANGTVLLLNPNGILFSPSAKVDVGSLLATTLQISERDFQTGRYRFRQSPNHALATVENFGDISIKDHGFAALVAPGVRNQGLIQAKFGQVVLGAGTAFTLDFYQDGLISFEVDAEPNGLIIGSDGQPVTSLLDQSGQIRADGGSVFLTAQSGANVLGNVINLDGITQARTVKNQQGKIVLAGPSQSALISGVLDVSGDQSTETAGAIALDGSQLTFENASLNASGGGGGQIQVSALESVTLDEQTRLSADAIRAGDAGAIAVLSDDATQIAGDLSAAARHQNGEGGRITTSGQRLAIAPTAAIDLSAVNGTAGTLTLDPERLFVNEDGGLLPGSDGGFSVAAGVIVEALSTGDVALQANDLIQIDAPIDTTDVGQLGTQTLSLLDQDANNDLTVNLNAPITLAFGQTLEGEATEVNVGLAAAGIAQNAVDVAAQDAVINLSEGRFNRAAFQFADVLSIDQNLTIIGQGPTQTILDGQNEARVVTIAPEVTVTLENLSLENGSVENVFFQDRNGGGLLAGANTDVSLENVNLSGNSAALGGGIFAEGRLTLQNSIVSGNNAINVPTDNYEGDGGFYADTLTLSGIGGGIYGSADSTLNIIGSTVSANNSEVAGGGVANLGDGTIAQSDISGNTSQFGAGLTNLGSLDLTESTVSGNISASSAGGIANGQSILELPIDSPAPTLTVTQSRIENNMAEGAGGGVSSVPTGTTTIESSEISNNQAITGGGVYSQGQLELSNTTISGNEANTSGAGLALEGGSATLTHVTIANNQIESPEGNGGGIASNNATLTLNSSIVSGNAANINAEFAADDTLFNSNGSNFVGQNGDRGGFQESETVFETAFEQNLSPLDDHGSPIQTHALLPGSIAIDAAPTNSAVDQRGVARPQGLTSDAGAFESQGFSVTLAGEADDQETVVNTEFPIAFQVTANDAAEPVEGGIVTVQVPLEGPSISEPLLEIEVDADGLAEATATANTIAGEFDVIAQVGDNDVTLTVQNLPDAPAFVSPFSGTPQSAQINTPFETLQARVTDQFGNEVTGALVSFDAPVEGPSAIFTTSETALTDELGLASVELTANDIASPQIVTDEGIFSETFTILASIGDLDPAEFVFSNVGVDEPPIAPPIEPPVASPVESPGTPPIEPPVDSVGDPVTPPIEPPVDSVGDPVDPSVGPISFSTGGPVERVNEELEQTFDSLEVPRYPNFPVPVPTAAIALTPRLEQQLVAVENVFTNQYQQFFGDKRFANETLRPSMIRDRLKRAKDSGSFNPAVIYAFFAPADEAREQMARASSRLIASADPHFYLAQSDIQSRDCLAERPLGVNDPLWQFDSCGFNNFAPMTRPADESDPLVVLLITPEGRTIRQVIPEATRGKVLATVKNFQRSVTDLSVPVRQSQVYGQEVFNWIVTPLKSDLEAEGIDNLVFILDEGLRSMPLAAMHDGSNYLIETYSVGLMPSMSLADTDFRSVKGMQVLAMGAAEFQGLSPLPSVPVELSTIAQDIWQGETFLNERFTLQALQTARSNNDFGIVHLATHGEFRAGDRERSYIQFWDQKLRIDELEDLGLTSSPPVSLLVLSACRTALGDPNAELGFTGLAVSSGVQTAMGGLWYVSDLGTLGLMSNFYSNLQTAPIKAEALRLAQLSMMTGTTRIENAQVMTPARSIPLPPDLQQISSLDLSHPYYWSGITMIGTPW